jgi:RNA polymerase sigma-70 factor (ECF subfamily)
MEETESQLENQRQLDDQQILKLVMTQLETFPEKCQVIFRLSRIEGFSNSEIAEHLNIAVKTVENQINKAQGKLRFSLKNFLGLVILIFFK